jgi:hypothetical protein
MLIFLAKQAAIVHPTQEFNTGEVSGQPIANGYCQEHSLILLNLLEFQNRTKNEQFLIWKLSSNSG